MVWGDPLQIGGRAARVEGKPRTCDIKGCKEPHEARGWCSKHYHRWRTWGDPLHTRRGAARTPAGKIFRHAPGDVAKVAQLHDDGLSYAEIAKRLGLTKNAVYGIHRRRKQTCPTS
jgi:hypothetical protein